MIDVSIILVNYNTYELLKNVISSLKNMTKEIKYEIIIVDNASEDESVEYLKQLHEKKEIIFIKNNSNLGFGKANNKGIEIARGKYIFLLNTDTYLLNNAIKILYDFMEQNEKVGICGGNLYTKEGKPAHSYSSLPNVMYDWNESIKKFSAEILGYRFDFNYSLKNKKVGYITGADMFIRKEVLEKVGYFDKDFFMYFEETELSYRIKKAGYEIYSVPEAKIVHLEGKSFKFRENRFKMIIESKYKYFFKVYGKYMLKYIYFFSQVKYLLFFNKNSKRKYNLNKEIYKNIKGSDKI